LSGINASLRFPVPPLRCEIGPGEDFATARSD